MEDTEMVEIKGESVPVLISGAKITSTELGRFGWAKWPRPSIDGFTIMVKGVMQKGVSRVVKVYINEKKGVIDRIC
jgi:hypothetical protein